MIRFLVSLILIFFSQVSVAQQGKLTIRVSGLRSDKGEVLFSLFSSSDGFPDSPTKSTVIAKARINNGIAEVSIPDLKAGNYAVAVLHDENSNGKMDTNLVGIPKEGYGASRDAKGFMGPPKYEDARFSMKEPAQEISIKINYF